MSARDTDGFYWEPAPSDDLRQGDLLFNVPMALMPQTPRFVVVTPTCHVSDGEKATTSSRSFQSSRSTS